MSNQPDEWANHTEVIEDVITSWPVEALAATFELTDRSVVFA